MEAVERSSNTCTKPLFKICFNRPIIFFVRIAIVTPALCFQSICVQTATFLDIDLKMPLRSNFTKRKRWRAVHAAREKRLPSGHHPPKTCAANFKQTPERIHDRLIATIYFDINLCCHFRKIAQDISRKAEDKQFYRDISDGAKIMIENGVADCLAAIRGSTDVSRSAAFINELGWKMFSICAHSEGFRKACLGSRGEDWLTLKEAITAHKRSIELFARAQKLDWRGPLLRYAQLDRQIPAIRQILGPEIDIAREHPHHMYRRLDGNLHRPRFQGKPQVNVESQVWVAKKYAPATDPSIREPSWGSCDLCRSPVPCDCRYLSLAGSLTEVVEYEGKGIGVRALTNFAAREWLGEYTGEVVPAGLVGDDKTGTYTAEILPRPCPVAVGKVDAAFAGSWVRYINHSCDASATFGNAIIGNHSVISLRANRDISIFEEITVDYGDEYFKAAKLACCCGSENCRGRKWGRAKGKTVKR